MIADPPRLRRSGGPRPGIGIVHLGLGAFFRAHGAIYIADAMRAGGGDWGILGVSLVRPGQRDKLDPQDYAYTAVELGPEAVAPRIVDIVQGVLVAREDPAAVLDAMADPAVRIVTLTVTEKGYCHAPATGTLDFDHPDVRHDLGAAGAPRSAPGFLVRALARRRDAGIAPFTVLCCDNLPANGPLVRGLVLELAARVDPALAAWIAAEGAFPASVVDRIVPATGPDDIAKLAARTGVLDCAPVLHEPFRQWVIEDRFVGGARPDFEAVGVQLVPDVAPFAAMKLRMLNGAHSALAYLGYLAGHETIADTVADAPFAAFCAQLWRTEVIPSLTPPEGADLAAHAAALGARFANPALRHRTWQIAMDGSQKLPQRLLGTIADNRAAGRPCRCLGLAVAAWMRYVGGTDEAGRPIDVRDPLADRLRRAGDAAAGPAAVVEALMGLREVFAPALAQDRALREELAEHYARLVRHGARAAVREMTQ